VGAHRLVGRERRNQTPGRQRWALSGPIVQSLARGQRRTGRRPRPDRTPPGATESMRCLPHTRCCEGIDGCRLRHPRVSAWRPHCCGIDPTYAESSPRCADVVTSPVSINCLNFRRSSRTWRSGSSPRAAPRDSRCGPRDVVHDLRIPLHRVSGGRHRCPVRSRGTLDAHRYEVFHEARKVLEVLHERVEHLARRIHGDSRLALDRVPRVHGGRATRDGLATRRSEHGVRVAGAHAERVVDRAIARGSAMHEHPADDRRRDPDPIASP
jgi:hypothetical protein